MQGPPETVTSSCHHFESRMFAHECDDPMLPAIYGSTCAICDLPLIGNIVGFVPPCAPHQHFKGTNAS